jgi:hypothetical protein
MLIVRTGSRFGRQHFHATFQNRRRLWSVSSAVCWSQEIVMASSRTGHPLSRFAFATTPAIVALLAAGDALASQGPGGGPGTAGNLTQFAMAVIVYGTSALVVGAGLIGAVRRR